MILPERWSFVSANGKDVPDILPWPGDKGTLHFIWITPPPNPIEFKYTVYVPDDLTGSQYLSARVECRFQAGEIIDTMVEPNPLVFKKCKGGFDEDGDVDGDDLFEFSKDENGVTLKRFAEQFGRIDCD